MTFFQIFQVHRLFKWIRSRNSDIEFYWTPFEIPFKIPHNNFVYCIRNPHNDKKYIGQTSRGYRRFVSHVKDFQTGKNTKFYRQLKKEGCHIMKCEFTILYVGEDACKKEKEFIKKYNTYFNGYNNSFGGEAGNTRRRRY